MANIGTLEIDLQLLTQRFEAGINRAQQRVSQFGNQLAGAVGTAAGYATNGLLAVEAAALAATAQTLALAKQIDIASEAFNVDKNALQLWTKAAQQVGLEGDKMSDIFKDVNDRLGDLANTGGGEAKDLFEELNLDIKEFVGLKPDQAVLKIGEALEKSKMTQAQKIHWMEGLSDDSSKLLPLLEANFEKLREIQDLTERTGSILTDDQLDTLDEANDKVDEITSALQGLGNVAAVAHSEMINTFGDDVTEALITIKDGVVVISDEVKIMAEVWGQTTDFMIVDTSDFTSETQSLFMATIDKWRIGISYLPMWYSAAYEASHQYGVMFHKKFEAANFKLGAVWQNMFAGLIEIAGWGFGAIADMAGAVAGGIAGRIADSLGAAGSALSYIPGMEALGENLGQAETSMRTFEAAANSAGDSVRASLGKMAEGHTARANASLKAAELADFEGNAAQVNAQYALVNAQAKMDEAEANRTLSKEMAGVERQFDKLNSKYDIDAAKNTKSSGKATLGKAAMEEAAKEAAKGEKSADKLVKKAKEAKEELNTLWLSGSVAFKDEIEKYSAKFNVDANFVKAIIQQETGFLKDAAKQMRAVSPVGALGVMQVMPATGKEVADKLGMRSLNLKSAADNIAVGTAYLAQQLQKYDGDIVKAAAAYNAGSGAVDKYKGVPPYKETQNYVKKVLGYYEELTKGAETSGKSQMKAMIDSAEAQQKAADKIAKEQQQQAEKAAEKAQNLKDKIEAIRNEATMTTEEFKKWEMVHRDGIPAAVADSIQALEKQKEKAAEITSVWENMMAGTEDALVSLVTTGKADWKSLVDNMIQEIVRLAVVKPLMKSLFGADNQGGMFDSFLSMFQFADGGVMSSAGAMPLTKYANGGVATSPQIALFGEGAHNEAYVPLPDGRTIPVTMKGTSGGAAPVVNLRVINNGQPMAAKTETTQTSNGFDISVILEQIDSNTAKGVRTGNSQTAQAMQDTFGLRRSTY